MLYPSSSTTTTSTSTSTSTPSTPPLLPHSTTSCFLSAMLHGSRFHKAEAKFNVITECKLPFFNKCGPYMTGAPFNSPTSRFTLCCSDRQYRSRKICALSWPTHQLGDRRRTSSPCCLFRWKRYGCQIVDRQWCGRKRSKVMSMLLVL